MTSFDPSKYGAIPAAAATGFDPSKYGATPFDPSKYGAIPVSPSGTLTPSEQRKRENLALGVIAGKMTIPEAAVQDPVTWAPPPSVEEIRASEEAMTLKQRPILRTPGLSYLTPEQIQAEEVAKIERAKQNQVLSEIHRQLAPQAQAQPAEGFWPRTAAGLKLTGTGAANYLRSRYPEAQIYPDPKSGSIIIKEPNKPARFLDKRDLLELGDIADVSGEALEAALAIPLTVAGTAATGGTAAPAVAAGSAAVAQAARQGVASLVPGEEDLTLGERAAMIGLAGAGGAVGTLATQGIAKGFRAITPTARLSRRLASEVVPSTAEEALLGTGRPLATTAREGSALAAETGVPLTMAQASGSRIAEDLESALRVGRNTAGRMFKLDVDRAVKLRAGVDKTLIESFKGKVSAHEAGRRTAKAYDANLNHLVRQLKEVGGKQFDDIASVAGNELLFSTEKTVARLDKLIEESVSPVSKSAHYLKGLRRKFVDEIRNESGEVIDTRSRVMTAREFQNTLSDLREVAQVKGDAFTKLSRAKQTRYGRELFSAALEDLDAATRRGGSAWGYVGKVRGFAKQLQEARSTYQKMMQAISSQRDDLLIEASSLASEGRPDALPRILLAKRSDDEVSKTLQTLAAIDPDAALALQRATLDVLLRRSAPEATTGLAREGVTLGPKEFAGLAEKYKSRIEALFAGDRNGFRSWNRMVEVAKRISNAPYDINVKAPGWGDRIIRALDVLPGKTMNLVKVGRLAQRLVNIPDSKLVRLLNDSESRDLLLRVYEPKPGTTHAQYTALVGQLLAYAERRGILSPEEEETSE